MNFNEFLVSLNNVDQSDRLNFVLKKLFEVQKPAIEENDNLFVFSGKIVENSTGTAGFATNVHSITGRSIQIYPFDYNKPFMVYCSAWKKYSDEDVIFTVKLGRLKQENELFKVSSIKTLSSLNLSRDSSVEEIIVALQDNARLLSLDECFEDTISEIVNCRRSRLRDLNDSINSLYNQNNALSLSIEEKTKSYNAISTKLDEAKLLLSEYAPDGVDQLRTELISLSNETERIKEENSKALSIQVEVADAQRLARFYLSEDKHPDHIYKQDTLPRNANVVNEFINRTKYAYSKALVVPFLTALSTTQIIVLFGKPGTGKTTFVDSMSRALGAKASIISVQNNWTDNSDLLGYYSPIDHTYESTAFVEALLDAQRDWLAYGYKSRMHIICLDEMNLARVEYYFAAFLSMLQLPENKRWINLLPKHIENELDTLYTEGNQISEENIPENKRYLLVLKDYKQFLLPPNVRFVGTINSDDTTNMLSPKVIDRSFFIELSQEQHATPQTVDNEDGYYPLDFFFNHGERAADTSVIDVFSKENNRFLEYAKTMLLMYRTNLRYKPKTNECSFTELLIISKVLPALTHADDYRYTNQGYRHADEAFEKHRTGRGNSYNYLGGQQ